MFYHHLVLCVRKKKAEQCNIRVLFQEVLEGFDETNASVESQEGWVGRGLWKSSDPTCHLEHGTLK